MEVVNLRRTNQFDVYGGRAASAPNPTVLGADGRFGNPIILGAYCRICRKVHAGARSTLDCFRIYFNWRVENDAEYRADVLALDGKRVACFCAPADCHLDIIAAWLQKTRRAA